MHFDPEHSFLLQIRGTKRVCSAPMSDARSRLRELERYFDDEACAFDVMTSTCDTFVLNPGDGLYLPSFVPHWVEQTGDTPSISFSIPFYTRFCPHARIRCTVSTSVYGDCTSHLGPRVSGPRSIGPKRRCCGPGPGCVEPMPMPHADVAPRRPMLPQIVDLGSHLSPERHRHPLAHARARTRRHLLLPDTGLDPRVVANDRRATADFARALVERRRKTAGTRRPEPGSSPDRPSFSRVDPGHRQRRQRARRRRSLRATRRSGVAKQRRRLAARCRRRCDAPSPGCGRGK